MAELIEVIFNADRDLGIWEKNLTAFILTPIIEIDVLWFKRKLVVHNSKSVDTREMVRSIRQ